jgi:hypothetical protein
MMRRRPVVGAFLVALVLSALAATSAGGGASAAPAVLAAIPTNIDVSQRAGNESEEAIAVNPTNPDNIVVVTNIQEGVAGLFEGVSFDGGATWTRKIIADGTALGDGLGDGCCDPSLAFDQYGNLFFSYLYNVENVVPVALSTNGGLDFTVIANLAKPPKPPGTKGGERHGEYRYVDQETIVTGPGSAPGTGSVWLVVNGGGPMVATGATVSGLGQVGTFIPNEVIPGTNNCTYGDVAIGPGGKVMNVCTLTETGQGGGKIFVNVDPDGVAPDLFGNRVFVASTHVGGFNFIPAQAERSVDAEPGLAWDRTGGPHNGRVYVVYSLEEKNGSNDLNIYVRHSDDDGATWSTPLRVNDDTGTNSQFMPKIALDPTDGHLAVVWYDARNDLGTGGAGDTDGIPNDDAQFRGAFSTDGGTSFSSNLQISAGTSNSHDSGNGIDYGDYTGLSFYGGTAYPSWSDNSNSTGNNPDGALSKLDIYTAAVSG